VISFFAKLENLHQHNVVWLIVSESVGISMYLVPFAFSTIWFLAFTLEHGHVLIGPVNLLVNYKEMGAVTAC
jgi:hypothetical protein